MEEVIRDYFDLDRLDFIETLAKGTLPLKPDTIT